MRNASLRHLPGSTDQVAVISVVCLLHGSPGILLRLVIVAASIKATCYNRHRGLTRLPCQDKPAKGLACAEEAGTIVAACMFETRRETKSICTVFDELLMSIFNAAQHNRGIC